MKKIILILLMTIVSKIMICPAKTPFSMNGWQFHEYDIPKLVEAIQKAPQYGVNFFIFSHKLFRSVEGFLISDENLDVNTRYPHLSKLYSASSDHTKPHPGWQRDLLTVAALAEKQTIPYYLWIHEFDDIPDKYLVDGDVDFDHPDLFPYIRGRYEKLLSIVPNTAGFVLTFHESDYKIFRNSEVRSNSDVPERMVRLTKVIYDVAKAHGKQLILRSFFYEPLEMNYFMKALKQLPDDLIVMSKTTFHEFNPFYPPDDMHGQVGEKRQIIEIDLGVEKAWSSQGAYAQLEYIQRYVRRAGEKGLAGMVGRARLLWDRPFDDSHEINLYAFSRFMENPDLSVDEVAEAWVKRRYPETSIPYIVSALKRTQYINHHGRYHLGFWLTKSIGSEWDDYRYYFGHIMERSRYKWTRDAADKELESRLYNPDIDLYQKLVMEKDEVLTQIRASMADLEMASRYLTAEQLAPLAEDFKFLLDAALLSREWTRAFFAQRLYMGDPKPEFKMWTEDALHQLEKLDKFSGITYGLDTNTGHRYQIDLFSMEMRWRLANRSRAIAEDKIILKNVRRKMDVYQN